MLHVHRGRAGRELSLRERVDLRACEAVAAPRIGVRREVDAVAIAADVIQILLLPLVAFGGLSPADTIIDLAVAVILWRLITLRYLEGERIHRQGRGVPGNVARQYQ